MKYESSSFIASPFVSFSFSPSSLESFLVGGGSEEP